MRSFYLIVVALLIFSACGDDIYEKPKTVVYPPATLGDLRFDLREGIFIDDPVAGLRYLTTTLPTTALTNSDGIYYYNKGDEISFYMGQAPIGNTVLATYQTTPLDLFNTDDITDRGPTNLARFLQTLDSDENTSNGIEISSATDTLADYEGVLIDFTLSYDSFEVDDNTTHILNTRNLVPEVSAQNNVTSNLNVDFNSSLVSNQTFTILWDLGSRYSIYKFGDVSSPTVEMEEEHLYSKAESNLTGYEWEITTDNQLRIYNATTSVTYESLDLLALTHKDTLRVESSIKGFISMRSAPESFNINDVNGSQYALLRADGDYIFYDFTSTTTATATFPEDANATLTYSIGADGNLTSTGTVAGVGRSDALFPKINHGSIAKVDHNKSATSVETASFVKGGLPFYDAMVSGVYHCITNKGLYYKLQLNSNKSGSLTYQTNEKVGEEITGGTFSVRWSIDGLTGDLNITNTKEPYSVSTTNLIVKLRAMKSDIYLVNHLQGFSASTENVLMYKEGAKKGVSEIVGTYDISWEDYNSTTGEVVISTAEAVKAIIFNSDGTGRDLLIGYADGPSFTWGIDGYGRIVRTFDGGFASSIMTIMFSYRDTIFRVTDNDFSNSTYIQKFMTLKRR